MLKGFVQKKTAYSIYWFHAGAAKTNYLAKKKLTGIQSRSYFVLFDWSEKIMALKSFSCIKDSAFTVFEDLLPRVQNRSNFGVVPINNCTRKINLAWFSIICISINGLYLMFCAISFQCWLTRLQKWRTAFVFVHRLANPLTYSLTVRMWQSFFWHYLSFLLAAILLTITQWNSLLP